MPIILAEEHHGKWLGEVEDGNLKELLEPYPADQMKIWPISQRVNSPKMTIQRSLNLFTRSKD